MSEEIWGDVRDLLSCKSSTPKQVASTIKKASCPHVRLDMVMYAQNRRKGWQHNGYLQDSILQSTSFEEIRDISWRVVNSEGVDDWAIRNQPALQAEGWVRMAIDGERGLFLVNCDEKQYIIRMEQSTLEERYCPAEDETIIIMTHNDAIPVDEPLQSQQIRASLSIPRRMNAQGLGSDWFI